MKTMEKYKVQAEDCFKQHKATLKVVDEDTQILTWKHPNSIYYSVEFIFRKNMIFVHGDMGNAVFECTWNPTWNYNWETMFLDYFAEKCKMITGDIVEWNSSDAIKDIKEGFRERFEELNDDEYELLFDSIKEKQCVPFPLIERVEDLAVENLPYKTKVQEYTLLDLCLAVSVARESWTSEEFVNNFNKQISLSQRYENIEKWGCKINPRIPLFLWALRMAKEQLKNNKE